MKISSTIFTTPLGRLFLYPDGSASFLGFDQGPEELDSTRLREAAENLNHIADLIDKK